VKLVREKPLSCLLARKHEKGLSPESPLHRRGAADTPRKREEIFSSKKREGDERISKTFGVRNGCLHQKSKHKDSDFMSKDKQNREGKKECKRQFFLLDVIQKR
jgi:hypothetical protein